MSQSNKHCCPYYTWEFAVVWGFKFVAASLGAKFQQESFLLPSSVPGGWDRNKSPCREAQYWFQLHVYMRIISGHTIWDMIAKSNYFSSPLLRTQTYQTALKYQHSSRNSIISSLFESNTHTESLILSHPQAITTSLPFKPQGKSLNPTATLWEENQN